MSYWTADGNGSTRYATSAPNQTDATICISHTSLTLEIARQVTLVEETVVFSVCLSFTGFHPGWYSYSQDASFLHDLILRTLQLGWNCSCSHLYYLGPLRASSEDRIYARSGARNPSIWGRAGEFTSGRDIVVREQRRQGEACVIWIYTSRYGIDEVCRWVA